MREGDGLCGMGERGGGGWVGGLSALPPLHPADGSREHRLIRGSYGWRVHLIFISAS